MGKQRVIYVNEENKWFVAETDMFKDDEILIVKKFPEDLKRLFTPRLIEEVNQKAPIVFFLDKDDNSSVTGKEVSNSKVVYS